MRLARVMVGEQPLVAARLTDEQLVSCRWLAPELAGADPVSLAGDPGALGRLEQRLEALSAALVAGQVSLDWLRREGVVFHSDDVRFLPPVAGCSKCFAVALNYVAHAEEGNLAVPSEPAIFLKAPSSFIGHGQEVIGPPSCSRIDFEVELAVVIGRRCRNLRADAWQHVVAGYTVINDVTARDLQLQAMEAQLPWDRTKSFDTFGPIGPWLVTPDEVGDPQNLELELVVDGVVRQRASTAEMVFPIGRLLEIISESLTLEPGDVIATGTPAGIGQVEHGQVMYARVGHLGVLANPVIYGSSATGGPQ